MKQLIGMLAFALIVAFGTTTLSFAADPAPAPPPAPTEEKDKDKKPPSGPKVNESDSSQEKSGK